MRKFVRKICCLLILSVGLIFGFYIAMAAVGKNTSSLASEVFFAREKAQRTNDCTKVYMGDSVCNQLWSEYDEDIDNICHIGCNQAITPVGSYLLLKEYLEYNPQTEEVYYLVRPQTLANDIWLDFSYQYFIIPFCDEENRELLEAETREDIYNKFGAVFVNNKVVKRTLLNNNLFMKKYLEFLQYENEEMETHRISKTTVIYLAKMETLCREHDIKLIVRSNPLSDIEENHGWDEFEQDILDYGFDVLLGSFIQDIPYYPKEWFSDGVHFKKDILEKYGADIRKAVLPQQDNET